jgi:hypothetical protein
MFQSLLPPRANVSTRWQSDRVIRDPEGFRLEHFWLCGACYLQYDFCFTKDKTLSIEPQIGGGLHRKRPELRLIEGRLAS